MIKLKAVEKDGKTGLTVRISGSSYEIYNEAFAIMTKFPEELAKMDIEIFRKVIEDSSKWARDCILQEEINAGAESGQLS